MTAPVRIQLSRAKGWRKPDNTVVVARPSKFGNPHDWRDWLEAWREALPGHGRFSGEVGRDRWCRDRAVQAFREDLADGTLTLPLAELRGHNLACRCPPDDPCHADVLIELANAPEPA